MLRKVFLLFLLYSTCAESAKILGVFPMPSYSHYILGENILRALAQKGHEVTMVSAYSLKKPLKNYEDIVLDGVSQFKGEGIVKMIMDSENATLFTKFKLTQEIFVTMTEFTLNDTKVQNLLSSDRTFDLVIMDWALNDAVIGFAHHYNAPAIILCAFGSSFLTNKLTGNPAPYSFVPAGLTITTDDMTFFQRLESVISHVVMQSLNYFLNEPEHQRLLHQYFPTAPSLSELFKSVSLVFLNSHSSIESPRPFLPNMIQIAGLHLQEPGELPQDLKKYLDGAKEGVVYFSLGSNVRISDLSKDQLDAIIKTFQKLPVQILWKSDESNLPNIPKNVRIEKWLPQTEVLAHPNVRVFVTHGGLLSTIEAIHHAVPMVGIPCFSDQMMNVANSVRLGYALRVTLEELSGEILVNAIKEVLNNPKYRENIKNRSEMLRDQPVKPLDNAVYWVEYVLKHKGAEHLKSHVRKLSWYQYFLIDVMGFLVGLLLAVYLILRCTVELLKCLISSSKKAKTTKPKGEAEKPTFKLKKSKKVKAN